MSFKQCHCQKCSYEGVDQQYACVKAPSLITREMAYSQYRAVLSSDVPISRTRTKASEPDSRRPQPLMHLQGLQASQQYSALGTIHIGIFANINSQNRKLVI